MGCAKVILTAAAVLHFFCTGPSKNLPMQDQHLGCCDFLMNLLNKLPNAPEWSEYTQNEGEVGLPSMISPIIVHYLVKCKTSFSLSLSCLICVVFDFLNQNLMNKVDT